MRARRRGRALALSLFGVGALALACLTVLLAGRLQEVRAAGLRARQALVTTAPGDYWLVDSLPQLGGGTLTLVTQRPTPPSGAPRPAARPARDRAAPLIELAISPPGPVPEGPFTLLFAYAADCPFCNALAPTWAEVASIAEARAPDVRVRAVAALPESTTAAMADAAAFRTRHGHSAIPTAVAASERTQRALALRSVPQTVLADATGRVWWAARDSTEVQRLRDSLPVLLARFEALRRSDSTPSSPSASEDSSVEHFSPKDAGMRR